jgi:transposase
LSSASGVKSNTKPYAVGCIVLDLCIKKESDVYRRRAKSTGSLYPANKKAGKAYGQRILYMDEADMLAGKRQRRVNFIAAVNGRGHFIEPLVFEGACTREIVESWLEALVEQLPRDGNG